jgi:hypothetical protein
LKFQLALGNKDKGAFGSCQDNSGGTGPVWWQLEPPDELKIACARLTDLVQSRKIIDWGISNHGEIPKNIFGRCFIVLVEPCESGRRLLRGERQLQVINDPVHDNMSGKERDNL